MRLARQTYASRCRKEVVRDLKESICGFPLWNMESKDLAQHLPVPGMPGSYELPVAPRFAKLPPFRSGLVSMVLVDQDGTTVDLTPELFRVPEMVFSDEGPQPDRVCGRRLLSSGLCPNLR